MAPNCSKKFWYHLFEWVLSLVTTVLACVVQWDNDTRLDKDDVPLALAILAIIMVIADLIGLIVRLCGEE
jgi:hypothetical protein